MKKLWLLLCLGMLAGSAVMAQTGVGFRGGMTYSQVGFVTTPSRRIPQEFVQGLEAGLVGRFLNSRHLGLQAELNYSRQGWDIFTGTTQHHQKEFHYLQLPILSHLQIGRGRFKFIVQAGAFAAYTSRSVDVISPDGGSNAVVVYDHQAEMPWQFGVLGGGGPALELPIGMLQLDFRFTQHLSNILETDLNRLDDFDASRQQIITFGLQWVYMFGEVR